MLVAALCPATKMNMRNLIDALRRLAALVPGFLTGVAFAQSAVTLTHVHGLSYSADGRKLMIASHHGLAVYEGGRWSKAPGPQHDYYLSRDSARTWKQIAERGEGI